MLDERIFISYGTADAEAHARWLHGELKKKASRPGSPKKISLRAPTGMRRSTAGLSSAKALVVVLTPGSVACPQGKGELNYALNHYLPVIPLIFASCKIPRTLDILNFLDFREKRDASLKKLALRLRDLDEKYPEELQRLLDVFRDARKTAPDPDRYNGKIKDLNHDANLTLANRRLKSPFKTIR